MKTFRGKNTILLGGKIQYNTILLGGKIQNNTILLGGPEQGTLEKRKTNAILDKKMVQNSSLVLVCDSFGKNTYILIGLWDET